MMAEVAFAFVCGNVEKEIQESSYDIIFTHAYNMTKVSDLHYEVDVGPVGVVQRVEGKTDGCGAKSLVAVRECDVALQ